MAILDFVNSSQTPAGVRAVIAGVEKVGKTTFAVSAPRAILVPLEMGYSGVTVMKTPMLDKFTDVITLLDEITN